MLTSNGYVLDERRLGELVAVPEQERTDLPVLRRRLQEDGYLLLRGLLDPQAVLEFRRYYFELTGGASDRASYRSVLFEQIVPGPEYAAFCGLLKGWFERFLGGEPFLHRRKIIRQTAPGENGIGTATQAHYDLVYLRGGSDQVLSAWIPLGDCPVSQGGLTYLERSHHRVLTEEAAGTLKRPAVSITADLPALADQYDASWLVTDYSAGDVVIHTAHTIHAALDNASDVTRLSTDIRYQRAEEAIDARWQHDWHDRDGL
ncbi:phytanoyl-CoA dioxygenase [Kribbella antibiotica]|uniref:Phytanoyl-CoA dioxygenase n=1 Tax=Kribbella antibiotica TaxID=190195 RepID=A0A4R4ZM06_9ACTN|nr:phytanoyl-CoA dioxygenase family protein [Kribbella antibiotica]TDD58924.1 phytanoyl-CoA dioxygenase [Kribbella antibiotica]